MTTLTKCIWALLIAGIWSSSTRAQVPVKYSMQQFLQLRGSGAPTLSPDGKWVVFPSSITGTSQLWRVPAQTTPDGGQYWPQQLTFLSEPVGGAQFSPDGKSLLYRKDEGGNERHQLYLLSLSDLTVDTLTNNPKTIHGGFFSDNGKSIYFQSNKRNEAFFDLYRMDLASRSKTLLFSSDDNNSLVAVSPNDKWLIFSRDAGGGNTFVYALDLKSSDTLSNPRMLIPHDEEADFNGYHFSSDGKRLYFFTNYKREFTSRAYVEMSDPKGQIHFRDKDEASAKWDVDQDIFSNDGRIEVVTRNINGRSELEIYNQKTGKRLASPPLKNGGFVSNVQVNDGANTLAFNYTSPTEISSIYVYDIPKKKLMQVTQPEYAGVDPSSFVSYNFIEYPSFDGTSIPAYYYKSKLPAPHPAIIYMHGGPEGQERPWFNSTAQYYTQQGFDVLIPNVRGSTGYGAAYAAADNGRRRETSVKDMEYANRWLRTQPGIDTSRIVLYGGSYGGFMVLAGMTRQPELWAAGVDLFGIANFHSYFKNTGAWRLKNRIAEYGDPVADSAFLVSISPLTQVDRITKPLFVYQGASDPRVPAVEAEQIVEALRKRNIPVEYILLPDEGHGISRKENKVKVFTAIDAFLKRVLW